MNFDLDKNENVTLKLVTGGVLEFYISNGTCKEAYVNDWDFWREGAGTENDFTFAAEKDGMQLIHYTLAQLIPMAEEYWQDAQNAMDAESARRSRHENSFRQPR